QLSVWLSRQWSDTARPKKETPLRIAFGGGVFVTSAIRSGLFGQRPDRPPRLPPPERPELPPKDGRLPPPPLRKLGCDPPRFDGPEKPDRGCGEDDRPENDGRDVELRGVPAEGRELPDGLLNR